MGLAIEGIRFNPQAIGVVFGRYDPPIHLREPMDRADGTLSGAGGSALGLAVTAGTS